MNFYFKTIVLLFLIVSLQGCESRTFKMLAGLYAVEKIQIASNLQEVSRTKLSFNALKLNEDHSCEIPTFDISSCTRCNWQILEDNTINLGCSYGELSGDYRFDYSKKSKKYTLVLRNDAWIITCGKIMSPPQWAHYSPL